jgi:hypothetical protein
MLEEHRKYRSRRIQSPGGGGARLVEEMKSDALELGT